MSERFEVAHLDELDRLEGEFVSHPVRTRFGITAFGVNAYSGTEAGGRIIEEHDELGTGAGHHEELYVVLSGRARFILDGKAQDAPAGTFVFVRDPAVRREAFAEEVGTTVLVAGGVPGQAFEPSPWEVWLEALAGEHEAALEHLRHSAELDPRVVDWAQSDSDLDPIRTAPGFPD